MKKVVPKMGLDIEKDKEWRKSIPSLTPHTLREHSTHKALKLRLSNV